MRQAITGVACTKTTFALPKWFPLSDKPDACCSQARMVVDEWIETLRRGECIKEHELKKLCSMVSEGVRCA